MAEIEHFSIGDLDGLCPDLRWPKEGVAYLIVAYIDQAVRIVNKVAKPSVQFRKVLMGFNDESSKYRCRCRQIQLPEVDYVP